MEEDLDYFLLHFPTNFNYNIILYHEIVLLPYRKRLYDNINLLVIKYLLPYVNINSIIQPLYQYKPTIFFHALYTKNKSLIHLLLKYKPKHYVYNMYSLLTAIQLKDISIIKLLIPHTDINFKIQNTTPYLYTISNFKETDYIYRFMKYHRYHKYGIQLLIYNTYLPISTIHYIKTFLI